MHAALAQLNPQKPKDDGYTKLVKAWNAASEDEQARFLIGLMKSPGTPWSMIRKLNQKDDEMTIDKEHAKRMG
jgi:hypothetical protein